MNTPKHIAIIMDGNGRWANQKGLPRTLGHKYGAEIAKNIIVYCKNINIKVLTLFVFSSENWKRSTFEISHLMYIFFTSLRKDIIDLSKRKICLQTIGQTKDLSKDLQKEISRAKSITKENNELLLNIAINYGGKWDIVEACKSVVKDVIENKLNVESLNENVFASKLSVRNLSEPDLFIRTGGEKRISNFFLWQLAYTECYFTDTLWPDFNSQELEKAILEFKSRKRKFGYVKK